MEELLERENINNQYILIVKVKHTPEIVCINTDKEYLERLVNGFCENLEHARLYKAHYPLTSLVKSWEKEN